MHPPPSGACEQELSEEPLLQLASVDLLALDAPTPHIARFLPWVKDSAAPFTFLVQIMVPGSTPIALCIAWAAQAPPDSPDSHQSMPQAPIDLSLARWAPKTLWGLAAACTPRQGTMLSQPPTSLLLALGLHSHAGSLHWGSGISG